MSRTCLSLLLVSTSCKEENRAVPASSSSSPAGVVATSGAPVESALPVAIASAAPSSSASIYAFTASKKPGFAEWCESELYDPDGERYIDGATFFPCAVAVVREWIAVECPENLGDGWERASQAPKGAWRGLDDPSEVGFSTGMFAFVTQLKPTQSASAEYFFRRGAEKKTVAFSLSWPTGAAPGDRTLNGKPFREIPFKKVLRDNNHWRRRFVCTEANLQEEAARQAGVVASASATKPVSAAVPSSSTASPVASFEPSQKAIAADVDVPDLEAAPSDLQWATVPEVQVPRSTFFGCETRLSGRWFRMQCTGKVLMTSGEIVTGRRPTQSKLEVSGGKLVLLTPYIPGTDTRVSLVTSEGKYTFRLAWPTGIPRPELVAKFEAR